MRGVIQEGEPLQNVEPPRCVEIEPVGRRSLPRSASPASQRVDGLRNGPPVLLSFDAFCRRVEQFPQLEELRLQGAGEPLVHPRFFDMVRHAAARGVRVSTTSRLQAFSRRRAEECVKSGLRRLEIPLDAAGTREYDFSRRGARHERMLRHLRLLVEARRAEGGALPYVSFIAVAMRRNLAAIADVVRLAHDHGVDAVCVQRLEQFVDATGILPGHRRMLELVEGESLAGVDRALVERHFAEARAAGLALGVALALPEGERCAGADRRRRAATHPAGALENVP